MDNPDCSGPNKNPTLPPLTTCSNDFSIALKMLKDFVPITRFRAVVANNKDIVLVASLIESYNFA